MTRDEAYRRLAAYMEIEPELCHIGMFDFLQCLKVQDFVDSVLVVGFAQENEVSLLSQIQPSRKLRPPRILLLGTEKVGKSTFASEMTSPVFLPVAKEEGIDDVDASAFPVARSFSDALDAVQALDSTEHKFKTFVIDSVSTLHPLVIEDSIREERVNTEAQLGGGYGHQYDTPLKKWTQLLDGIDTIRDRGMASILIGHVTAKRFDDPVNGGYTRYDLDLPSKISQAIYRWVDVILFANWEVYRVTEDAGFNKEIQRGTGSGSRVLYTQRRPSHPGGGRGVYGRLPYQLPFSASAFREAVKAQIESEKEASTEVAVA